MQYGRIRTIRAGKKMNAHALIQDFGAAAGLPEFKLDERGLARLKLDGELVIDFEYEAPLNVLHVYSGVVPAPHIGGEAQLRLLLEANLFLDRSGGSTFALDGITGEFIACLRLDPALLDGRALLQQVERLADAVERLRAELTALGQRKEAAAIDGGFPAPFDMLRG
jgi:hypothetical protein